MKKKYKILFIQPIGVFSGSLKSSEEYIKNLYKKFSFIFFTPRGYASKILSNYGRVFNTLGICKFDNTENSHYRGIRWLLIVREIIYFTFTILNLIWIKLCIKQVDLIHLNEITGLPTAILAKYLFKKPLIVHVRSLNNNKKNSKFSKLYFKIVEKFADKILAIDNDVLGTINIKKKSTILRNIFNLEKKINLRKNVRKTQKLRIGYIGTFLKYKGVEVLINATDKLFKKGYKIELVLAGATIERNFFLKKIYQVLNIDSNIDKNLLKKKFIVNLGFTQDIKNFYQKIDILCFPSSLNSTGRQIFEAGMFSKPVIVCLKKKKHDGMIDKYNGLIYDDFFSIKKLQKKILFFYDNRKLIKKMGRNGKKLAFKRNLINNNINRLIKIYITIVKKKLNS